MKLLITAILLCLFGCSDERVGDCIYLTNGGVEKGVVMDYMETTERYTVKMDSGVVVNVSAKEAVLCDEVDL